MSACESHVRVGVQARTTYRPAPPTPALVGGGEPEEGSPVCFQGRRAAVDVGDTFTGCPPVGGRGRRPRVVDRPGPETDGRGTLVPVSVEVTSTPGPTPSIVGVADLPARPALRIRVVVTRTQTPAECECPSVETSGLLGGPGHVEVVTVPPHGEDVHSRPRSPPPDLFRAL